MNNIINRDDLPKKKHGNKNVIDWINIKNHKVRFDYKGLKGFLIISCIKKTNGGVILEVKYGNKKTEMFSSNFIKGKLGVLLEKVNKDHKYKIGEKVNNVTIIEQTRRKDSRNNNILSYKVKCNVTGKVFYQAQFNIDYGYGSP